MGGVITQQQSLGAATEAGVGGVAELVTYPIKGCAGTATAETVVTQAGLAHDRTFLVVDAEGTFRSQRRDPLLATVRPDVCADGARLRLRAPGVEPLEIEVDLDGPRHAVTMFGAPYCGMDQGDGVAGWFSEVLGAGSRLVRVPPEHRRVTTGVTPGTCGFADSGALLITSQRSLSRLNDRIAARGAEPLPMERFRPNIVVDGWVEPHAEDHGRRIVVGEAELGYQKLCIRCAVTMVDQGSGRRAGPEPLRTLAAYRRADGGGVAFGSKYSVLRPGRIAVGDELVVVSWGRSELTAG